ncbi:MAG: type IV pilus modification PilV family protein [Polyangiales bacterium]
MMAANRPSSPEGGFTLLEVMVALAILGLALSAILSAQAGLYDANVKARNVSIGTSAARCKMNEVEQDLLAKGYPEADQKEEGQCCSGESPPGMSCQWKVERITLPDPPQNQMGDGGTSGGEAGSSPLGALGALAAAGANPGALGDGGLSGLSSMLAQPMGPGGQTGVSGIASMAMNVVYPQLKPLLEASIRKVTVDVSWNEGPNVRKVTVVQFVTNPQKGLPPIDPNMLGGDAGALPGASTGTPTTKGAGGIPATPTLPGIGGPR